MGIKNSRFIKACHKNNNESIPLWVMRQAGRYLPEYQEVRENVSFLELCRSPELIARVVKQPIDRFGFDAAILFSDILTMLEPMGFKIDFPDGGPVISNPITGPDDIRKIREFDIKKELSFVVDGIREIKKQLPDTPLIGFAGSPFTLACYLIEGRGSKNFNKAKQFLHKYPEPSKELFTKISDVITEYLGVQIEAGAEAVQLFESWGGILSHDDFLSWSGDFANKIFSGLSDKNVPRIFFVNNIAPYYDVVRDIDCEVAGIDYRTDLKKAAKELPGKALQGNLDPTILFGSQEYVKANTLKVLNSLDDHDRLIFNLGHGILPGTPLESVRTMVETVHNYR